MSTTAIPPSKSAVIPRPLPLSRRHIPGSVAGGGGRVPACGRGGRVGARLGLSGAGRRHCRRREDPVVDPPSGRVLAAHPQAGTRYPRSRPRPGPRRWLPMSGRGARGKQRGPTRDAAGQRGGRSEGGGRRTNSRGPAPKGTHEGCPYPPPGYPPKVGELFAPPLPAGSRLPRAAAAPGSESPMRAARRPARWAPATRPRGWAATPW